ncbi:CRISPR system Cascade subunit CasE [Kineosphaera limosa]|uniref:Putative CRISPR-associated protein n=1 Tax=Kineosphaera limosa NBRC 100340 TaxID=1184609 RepID=K6WN60_9MICO|nr:type I-E CRISPR-associated protein Cas6/Cse3/CasE [Kineosphaera limosa]NYE01507.1 CRISPR system Cascade subunit CasE [Kineosphaera limosa]GAB95251.1 putative CRISPR-associated protein [Kineosphaera limosa NBRC 100340]
MFLTRFALNRARRGARHLLASQQRMHAGVLAGFPPGADPGRVLWRIDESPQQTELFIASAARPDLTHLVEQAGWPTGATWDTADYSPFLERLAVGQLWGFRLTANPVRSVSRGAGIRGAVKAHVTPAQQEEWFLTRAAQLGFELPAGTMGVPDVVVKNRRTARFLRGDDRGREVTVVMATFEGHLAVTDPELLRTALVGGVGRAKAYGCGLLTLARA